MDYILKQPEGEFYINAEWLCTANLLKSALIMSSGVSGIAASFVFCVAEDMGICIIYYK